MSHLWFRGCGLSITVDSSRSTRGFFCKNIILLSFLEVAWSVPLLFLLQQGWTVHVCQQLFIFASFPVGRHWSLQRSRLTLKQRAFLSVKDTILRGLGSRSVNHEGTSQLYLLEHSCCQSEFSSVSH